MSEEKPRIGDIIKQARMRKKLSADDVARMVNVSRSRVYQWETASFIIKKNLRGLSKALGISQKALKAANGEREMRAG